MPKGLICTLSENSSANYAPSLGGATLSIVACGGAVSINGVPAVSDGTTGTVHVAIGQSIAISTGNSTTAVVSAA